MSFYDAIRVGASGAADFEVERSLRFNDDDSAYLNRTPSGDGNRKTWTWSAWIKRANIGSRQILFSADNNATHATYFMLELQADDNLRALAGQETASATLVKETSMVLRDTGAWYHIVFKFDATNATAVFYVNGQEITDYSSTTNPSNQNFQINATTQHFLGRFGSSLGTSYFDGYMAEVNFIDGQAYDSSYFGETDVLTGQWNPKKYTGSYGTNGFYLNFSDNSGTTATTLGKDSSGNGNNFTPNNFSVSAGDGNDSVTDTPTLNKATLNGLTGFTYNATLKNGNLEMTGSGGFKEISTIAVAGTSKLYYEVTPTSAAGWQILGVFVGQPNNPSNSLSNAAIYGFATTGNRYEGGSVVSGSPSWTTNDVMGVKYSNGTLQIYKNGTLYGTSITGISTSDIVFAYIANDNTNAAAFARFSSDSWTQDSAAGVDATWELSSANLPDPAILLPNKHFDTLLYTGNNYNGTRAITGYNFQPDWIWTKNRTAATSHHIYDEVRGLGSGKEICSDKTQAEGGENGAAYGYMTRYGTGGFNVVKGSDSTNGNYNLNINSNSYAAWAWNAGDTDGKTYTVTVVDDSGNKFRFDGFGTSAVTLDLAEGGTYIFNYPSAHPFRFSTTSDGTHGGGSEYTTGVTHNSSTQVTIVVAASAPTLYYYCSSHSGMGGQVNTNSTLGSSNFDGAIQSTVKVNATAGFSITAYPGNGSNAQTVGHGLGVAPDVIILKARGASQNWRVWHKSLAADGSKRLLLDSTNASEDAGFLNDTAPTSTLFTLGNSDDAWNASGGTYITYLFSEVAGYSKFGSYTGNGNADGTFVFTGFRPAWVMIKNTEAGSTAWYILDNKRDPDNPVQEYLAAEDSAAEGTYIFYDFLSNGFKLRNTGSAQNPSGQKVIYLAFSESPFKNARAR